MAEMLRLIITPDEGPGLFVARLEGSDEPIAEGTRQPLVDGSRMLVARGFNSATPLTMRHAGSDHDSFHPLPISNWAGWTYEERERDGIRCAHWSPRQLHAEGQKSGSEPPVAPKGQPTTIRFFGDPPRRQSPTAEWCGDVA